VILSSPDPTETTGFASLRLEAWDADGNRIEQEIIRAWRLAPADEPGEGLRRLHQAILRQDASLDLPEVALRGWRELPVEASCFTGREQESPWYARCSEVGGAAGRR
jgi:hypothetical protein